MTTYTESDRIGDFLKREWDPALSREVVTLISGQNLKAGEVVGKITASGKFTDFNAGAADGSQTAAGILLFDCDASSADTKCVILARGPAVLASGKLLWKAGTTDPQKATALATLAGLGIAARTTL